MANTEVYNGLGNNGKGDFNLISSGSGGSGDVVGPSSATDNAITRFDGTTGKLVQNSSATIADNGTIDTGTGLLTGGTNAAAARNYVDMSANVGFPAMDVSFPGGASTGQGDFGLGSGVFRAGQVGVLGTNDVFFQLIPLTIAGYGYLEGWGGAGLVIGTGGAQNFGGSGSSGGPIIFSPSRVEKMRLLEDGTLNVKNNITTDFTSTGQTRIVGIGVNSGLTSGSTGIFRFGDQYNQMSVTFGQTLDVLSYHGVTIKSNPVFGVFYTAAALLVEAVSTNTAASPVIVAKSAPSQSAEIQQWTDSSGNVLASVNATGDVEVTDATKGIILKSPNGSRWRITVNNSGVLSTTSI
jgi:hypothetical protein